MEIVEKIVENLAMPNLTVLEWFPEEVYYFGADHFPPLSYPKLTAFRTDKEVVFSESSPDLRLRELVVGLGVHSHRHMGHSPLSILDMYPHLRVCTPYISGETRFGEIDGVVTAPCLTHLSLMLGDKGRWGAFAYLTYFLDAPRIKELTLFLIYIV